MQLNINTDACFRYTDKLEKISRSALPISVRKTLNDVAFDVKQRTMPTIAGAEFVNRTKTFFKANSKVEPTSGFDINQMQSKVGFYENRLRDKSTNFAVKDLEQQEHGGGIDGKTFIPTVFARRGNAYNRMVRPNARLKEIRKNGIVDSKDMKMKYHSPTPRQQFILASKLAGEGGHVLYKNILWRIDSINGVKDIKRTPLYTVKKGRTVRVGSTHFMKESSEMSLLRMERFYVSNAKQQLQKYWDK